MSSSSSRDHDPTAGSALEGLADYLHDQAILAESAAENRVGGQRNRLLREAQECRAWSAAISSAKPTPGD